MLSGIQRALIVHSPDRCRLLENIFPDLSFVSFLTGPTQSDGPTILNRETRDFWRVVHFLNIYPRCHTSRNSSFSETFGQISKI